MTGSFSSYLQWTILPPFFPKETRVMRFHRQALDDAKWMVKLYFEEIRIDYWYFGLTLTLTSKHEESDAIPAKEVVLCIILGKRIILLRKETSYAFNTHNQYEFFAETNALMFSQMQPLEIVVEIGITLEEDVFSEGDLIRINSFRNHLMILANDLLRLGRNPIFPNVHLYSSMGKLLYAHSYVLMARWDNFFELHSFGTTSNTVVRTNISRRVLLDILLYMYSGVLGQGWPEWTNPSYITELFQVLHHYNIQHLHEVLAKSDSSQTRLSQSSALIKCYDFRLHFVRDGPVTDRSLSLQSQENVTMLGAPFHQYQFVLQVRVQKLNRAGAWLSYSILSRSESWAYVQVNFDIIKMVADESNRREVVRRTPVHTSNYSIHPNESKESGPVLFLGCLETFDGFHTLSPSGKIQQWFRFNISFTNGTLLDQYNSRDNNPDRRIVKYDILSNHMFKLKSEETHADIRLESIPRHPRDLKAYRFLHRAILKTRIPRLQDVISSRGPGQGLPAVATIGVSGDAMEYVVDYIYSGKVLNIPQNLLEEISDFANRAHLHALQTLIDSRRNDYINAQSHQNLQLKSIGWNSSF